MMVLKYIIVFSKAVIMFLNFIVINFQNLRNGLKIIMKRRKNPGNIVVKFLKL